MAVGDRIKERRQELGWSQRDLAYKMGYANNSTIVKIEANKVDVSTVRLSQFAQVLHTSVAYLTEQEDLAQYGIEKPQLKQIPLLGTIACGSPIFAEQNIEEHIPCPCGTDVDFCLRAKGDSMVNARIHDGDIVFIRQQDTVEDGEIAAVLVEDEATIKRVYFDRENNVLSLVPENPTFKVMRYMGADSKQVRILGKAILVQHKIQ